MAIEEMIDIKMCEGVTGQHGEHDTAKLHFRREGNPSALGLEMTRQVLIKLWRQISLELTAEEKATEQPRPMKP